MDNMPKVSIFTCVYNRADKIHRVFDSVKKQTYTNIEHIIIDDGSTDGVGVLVNKYIEEVSYPVIFKAKENGGKHTATNVAWSLATGDFIVQLDSDDELLPDAIERLVNLWFEIPESERSNYWCAQARVRTQKSNEVFGDLYPENINSLSPYEKRMVASRTIGEKIGLMKADIIKQYRYPEPPFVKFVTEMVVWKPVNKIYQTWYTNDVVRIYYVDEGDSLSKPSINKQSLTNKCWMSKWLIENAKKYDNISLSNEMIRYSVFWHLSLIEFKRENGYFNLTISQFSKMILGLLFVPAYFAALCIKIRKKI
jgi:glycosyltransferase involved in cell wall biosynthesis